MSAWLVIALVLVLGVMSGRPAAAAPLYFTSPEQAVAVTTELLRRDDWQTLARYYDLSGSDIAADDLTSGRFFLRVTRPDTTHPGLPWRYQHPFTPGFTFKEVKATAEPDVVVVVVGIEIDEGGGRVQRGLSEFRMRRSGAGYQVLPPAPRP